MARVHFDVKGGKTPRLGDYFDELLSDDELLERSTLRLAAHFDAMIGGDSVTEQ